MNKLVAVTIGDINGIGIHLLIKEWKKGNINNFIIFSNYKIFKNLCKIYKLKTNYIKHIDIKNFDKKKINIYNFSTKNRHTNALDSIKIAYDFTTKNKFIGILTLPLNKKEINKFANINFIDQTSFFSNLENNNATNMCFIYKKKIFIPLTIHIELKNVYKFFINKHYIISKIKSLNETLINDFKIINPRLIISGINPHAGEEGIISKDENKYLKPIINYLKKNKINIKGPISGDGMLNKSNLNYYDAFIFAYHDQALIPFKIISNFQGVNFTSNLSIIRVSPSHGTAKDMIGSNLAQSKSITNCFKIIRMIANNRK